MEIIPINYRDAYGEPKFNLSVELILEKTNFDNSLISPKNLTEMYEAAITVAKELFDGSRYVTDKGYLCNGNVPDLPFIKGSLLINHHIGDLNILASNFNWKNKEHESNIRIHREDGYSYLLRPDSGLVYLQEIRDEFYPNGCPPVSGWNLQERIYDKVKNTIL